MRPSDWTDEHIAIVKAAVAEGVGYGHVKSLARQLGRNEPQIKKLIEKMRIRGEIADAPPTTGQKTFYADR